MDIAMETDKSTIREVFEQFFLMRFDRIRLMEV